MKKTKTLFKTITLTIALTAASVLQSFAAPPSFTINISPGYNFIGNHLDVGNDTLNAVLNPASGVLAGSVAYKWVNGTATGPWRPATYNGATWSQYNGSDLTFAPGEAVMLFSPLATTITISGTLATLNLPVNVGTVGDGNLYALSDQHLPTGPSTYDDIVGAPPELGQCAWTWNGSFFVGHEFDTFGAGWIPSAPSIPIGGAMFVGCAEIPPIPEPGVFAVALCGTVLALRRNRSTRRA